MTDSSPIPAGMTMETIMALSDERDQWEKRILAAETAAYLRGYEDGFTDGSNSAHNARWVNRVNTLSWESDAEMTSRRYGPGGRLMSGEVKDNDYMGGSVTWQK